MYDGGEDIHSAFELSGEPLIPQIALYGDKPAEQAKASDIAALNVTIREIRKEYMEYWNGTKGLTNIGRPVDAIISPLAPFPAARPEKYPYYGYSMFVNLLDYTSVVVPVTTVDKELDKVDIGYKPLDFIDKAVYESCELGQSDSFNLFLMALQMIQRYMKALTFRYSSSVEGYKKKRCLR